METETADSKELVRSSSMGFTEDQMKNAYAQIICNLMSKCTEPSREALGELPEEFIQDVEDELFFEDDGGQPPEEAGNLTPRTPESVSSHHSSCTCTVETKGSRSSSRRLSSTASLPEPERRVSDEFSRIWTSRAMESIRGLSSGEKEELRQQLKQLSDKLIEELLSTEATGESSSSKNPERKAGGINVEFDQEQNHSMLSLISISSLSQTPEERFSPEPGRSLGGSSSRTKIPVIVSSEELVSGLSRRGRRSAPREAKAVESKKVPSKRGSEASQSVTGRSSSESSESQTGKEPFCMTCGAMTVKYAINDRGKSRKESKAAKLVAIPEPPSEKYEMHVETIELGSSSSSKTGSEVSVPEAEN